MLYKPKNLCPSTKLLPIVYSKEEANDYVLDLSFSSELHNEFQDTCEVEVKCGNEVITAKSDRANIENDPGLPQLLKQPESGTEKQYLIDIDSAYSNYPVHTFDLRQKDEEGQYLNTTTSGYATYYCAQTTSCTVAGHTITPSRTKRDVFACMTIVISQYIKENIEFDIKSKSLAVLSDDDYNAKKLADLFQTFFVISGNFSIEADVYGSMGSTNLSEHVSENLDFNQKYEIKFLLEDEKNPVVENPEDGELTIPFQAIHPNYNVKIINKLVSIVGKIVFIRDKENKSVSISKLILTPQNAIYAAHDRALTSTDEARYSKNEVVSTNISVDFYAQTDKFANDTIIAAVYPNVSLQSTDQDSRTDVKTYYIKNLDLYKDKVYIETGNSYFEKLLAVTSDLHKWKWRVKCTDKNTLESVYGNWETFLIESNRGTPKVVINRKDTKIPYATFTGELKSDAATYKSYLTSFQWKIYRLTENEDRILIYQTQKIYSKDFQVTYDGFIGGEYYTIEAIVEDNYGQTYIGKKEFNPRYTLGETITNIKTFGCFTNPENTSNKITWTYYDDKWETYKGYQVKRLDIFSNKLLDMGEYYYSRPPASQIYENQIIDYSLPHNKEVKYLIYGKFHRTTDGYIISDKPYYGDRIIKGEWDKWCLFTTKGSAPKNLDGTDTNGYNENVLLVDKIFFFEMNVETGSMTNNTDFSVIKNFTPYPHIQRSPSNYWSGQLKGLLGRLAINNVTFKQTPDMLQEIKELAQNTSRKFLKDRDGNLWEVELSSAITIDNNDNLDVQLKTKSFSWVEVGDASNIALVSVGAKQDDWLLTEFGQTKIDLGNYLWDDEAVWDDSDFWTEVQP